MAVSVTVKRMQPDKVFPIEVRVGPALAYVRADGSVFGGDAKTWLEMINQLDGTTEPGHLAICLHISTELTK